MDDESVVKPENSILLSVKTLLGLGEENDEFDLNLIMVINGAISNLTQIGVGPSKGFVVTSKNDTYEDWLGDMSHLQDVKMYLGYRTRLAFDPPSSSSLLECIKELALESETRLSYLVDPPNTFSGVIEEDPDTP